MSSSRAMDTEELLNRVVVGSDSAKQALLARHRNRLLQMVAVRMDTRLGARFDPSDVVQDALIVASGKLSEYARQRPLPYYLWLRQLAWERLLHLQRRHLQTQKRTVSREAIPFELSDASVRQFAERLVTSGPSPSRQLLRKELRQRVRGALQALAEPDREILVLRFLEQLKVHEVATMLEITPGAATMRQLRALERLRKLLE